MGHPGKRRSSHAMGSASNWTNYLSLPRNSKPPKAGQTVGIEPNFLFRCKGAVGIENTFAVTEMDCEILTGLSDNIICL